MIPAKLAFVVTTTARAGLAALSARVGKALGCTFAPHQDNQFDRGEAWAASVLGLRLTLSHDPDVAEGEERLYVLSGAASAG